MNAKNNTLLFAALIIAVCIAFFLQLILGAIKIPLESVITILGGSVENETWRNIIIESRLPGAVAALVAGAGLSVGGLQMQTLFRNPVAEPYVLGISAGASLGVAFFILAAPIIGLSPQVHLLSGWAIIISASLGAALIFALNFIISFRLDDVVAILIVGLMIGSGISAFIEILQAFSGSEALKNYVLWTFGSFRYVGLQQMFYLAVIVIPAIVFAFFLSKPLNLLLLGDTYASSLGLNIRTAKVLVVLNTSVLAGCVTAFCGPIGFVGLAVPHVARAIFKTSGHKILIPASALLGALICCLCNVISSGAGSGYALPVNAITSLLGAPAVIWIVLKQRKV